ncbi:transposase [Pseudonocardia xishanensis]|uniref:transposase n=1 Tax=Pseudonocardia xishanensis TaxID=630995 RepID=UPI003CD096B2
MDGFGGSTRTPPPTYVPDAVTVIGPFHVVAVAGHKLDVCQAATSSSRSRSPGGLLGRSSDHRRLRHRGPATRQGTTHTHDRPAPQRATGRARRTRPPRSGPAPSPRRRPRLLDHHVWNGPTEAINGRREALRRSALGFRNLLNYRIQSLQHCAAVLAVQIRANQMSPACNLTPSLANGFLESTRRGVSNRGDGAPRHVRNTGAHW